MNKLEDLYYASYSFKPDSRWYKNMMRRQATYKKNHNNPKNFKNQVKNVSRRPFLAEHVLRINGLPNLAHFSKPRRSHSLHTPPQPLPVETLQPVGQPVKHKWSRSKLVIACIFMLLPLLGGVTNPNAFDEYLPADWSWSNLYAWGETWISRPVAAVVKESPSWLHLSVGPGEDWSRLFEKYGLNPQPVPKLFEMPTFSEQLHQLTSEQELLMLPDSEGNLQKLILALPAGKELYVHTDAQRWVGEVRERRVQTVSLQRTVTHSLWETIQQAGLSETWWSQLVKIFRWNIDLVQNSQPGDQFTVIYEQHLLDSGDRLEGEILAAEYVSQGNVYQAVRYTDKTGVTAYYTLTGENLRKTFLLTPVDFTKVSSNFGLRKHPIFHKWKIHTGIDYAAPQGTPVTAAGEGQVVFMGWKGGYGKTVILEHGEHYRTLYGHLSKYAKGLAVGQAVKQEQEIGYVGHTGWATASHLHYEFYVDGVYQNPQQANLPIAMPIAQAYKADFLEATKGMATQLEALSFVNPKPAEKPGTSTLLVEQMAPVKPSTVESKATVTTPSPVVSMLQQQTTVSKEWWQRVSSGETNK